ncbi:PREDICTED: alpha/beta hydrolase domain-containing protein 13 isoform X2 [Ceratosolen solmsi marchali]|uniref:Protein ABHD13 n=1 Tax=Ceratosolen solmsi marchali TaxID=326594 RepID=A0AAJ6YQV2_9HYME|nr:PREDICTED: alpha/beta hydrolase domain-containing protein 13 isoform X2 [Ceratosolen solmsi marchali]
MAINNSLYFHFMMKSFLRINNWHRKYIGVLYNVEDKLLYYPRLPANARIYVPSPALHNLPYQSIYAKSSDGTLIHMFFIPQPEDLIKTAPTVLFLHGNAGNMGHRLDNVKLLYKNVHCNVLLLEYRGYGLSQGSPSEKGFYMDARTGIEYLYSRNDINTNEIIIFGRSLGGAVAIDIATRQEISQRIWCLIVENTFTSIPDMAMNLIKSKIIQYIPIFCYKNKYLSIYKIHSISVPTLFISGRQDKLVPPKMMDELFEACGSNFKRKIQILDGTHNETWNKSGYYQQIFIFLEEIRKKPPIQMTSKQWNIDEV